LVTSQEVELEEIKSEVEGYSQAVRLNGCNKPQGLMQKEKKNILVIWKLDSLGVGTTFFSMYTQIENFRYTE
jgi:hypothetical protein